MPEDRFSDINNNINLQYQNLIRNLEKNRNKEKDRNRDKDYGRLRNNNNFERNYMPFRNYYNYYGNEQNNDINYNVKDLFKDINDGYKIKIEKLFIIGSLLEEQNKFNQICSELTNYGIKNEYLEFENIQEMNKKFLTLGILPRKYEYQNEKYNK